MCSAQTGSGKTAAFLVLGPNGGNDADPRNGCRDRVTGRAADDQVGPGGELAVGRSKGRSDPAGG